MCDRTKSEVLARDFAIFFWKGMQENHTDMTVRDFTEMYWKTFEGAAKQTLEYLEKHND